MARIRVTISVDEGTIDWIDKMINSGIYYNRSHAFEFAIKQAKRMQNNQ